MSVDMAIDWEQHWASLGWPWRTQPEISPLQQETLTHRLTQAGADSTVLPSAAKVPRVRQIGDRVSLKVTSATYSELGAPFANYRLTRADIEWLLATHDGGKGPVTWDDPSQQQRIGVNLTGALLSGVNLDGLPMARTLLTDAQLESASLVETHLEGADLERAHFEGANLARACLNSANGMGVNLQGALLYKTQAQEVVLPLARMEAADLRLADFQKAVLRNAHFAGAVFLRAHFEGADCTSSFFVPSVDSTWEQLREKIPELPEQLHGANLSGVFLDSATNLASSIMFNTSNYQAGVQLADVHWGGTNLAVINWRDQLPSKGPLLGDELGARRLMTIKSPDAVPAMVISVRANRQVAVQLRDQGLNEEADRFAYRAQYCQKYVLRKQRHYGGYALSLILDLIAGYGYLPLRTLYTYIGIILTFAGLYLLTSQFAVPHLTWDEAIVLSMSSFHGRGFFSQQVQLGDTFARLAAIEALTGLLTEVSFIATFTQRFLGK